MQTTLKMRRLTTYASTALLTLGALSRTSDAAEETPAASSAEPALEEVTVTARRRSENMQRTPISITAFSGADLEARGIPDLASVGNATPNLLSASAAAGSGGTSNLQLFIRGVGQVDFLAASDPGVGLYVDGVYYARAMGSVMDLLDLERIEVLRGPQGTLFGKNTIGGAVQLVTSKPADTFGGTIEATYGRFNRVDVRGTVDLPINERVLTKLSFSSKNADGYGKRIDAAGNDIGRSMGEQSSFTVRGSVAVRFADNVELLTVVDSTRAREQSAPVAIAAINENAPAGQLWNALVGIPAGTPWTSDIYVTNDPFTTYSTADSRSNTDVRGIASTLAWDLDNIQFKSITAYREVSADFGVDQDGAPMEVAQTFNQDDQHQFSEELQLTGQSLDDRLTWLIGAFYFRESTKDFNRARLVTGLYPALEALPGPLDGSPLSAPGAPGGPGNPLNLGLDLNLNLDTTVDTTSYAAFSQATYDVTDAFSVTVGARYTHEKKNYDLIVQRMQSGTYVIPAGSSVGNTYTNFSPRIDLNYHWSDDVSTYLVYSQGFKAGGFDGRPTSAAEGLHAFKPERIGSYELGIKSELFDRRVRLNADVYYSIYRDVQLRSDVISQGVLVIATDNAGQARIRGLEAELVARATSRLTIGAGVGLTDFDYTELQNVSGVTFSSKAPKTPRWNANSNITYTLPTWGGSSLQLRGDWSYQSKVYQDAANTEVLAQPGRSLFNARSTWSSADDLWDVSAFVNNVGDKRAIQDGFGLYDILGWADTSYVRPREWGVSVRRRF